MVRRKRQTKKSDTDEVRNDEQEAATTAKSDDVADTTPAADDSTETQPVKKKRRRRRSRGRGGRGKSEATTAESEATEVSAPEETDDDEKKPTRKVTKKTTEDNDTDAQATDDSDAVEADSEEVKKPTRRRRSRRKKVSKTTDTEAVESTEDEEADKPETASTRKKTAKKTTKKTTKKAAKTTASKTEKDTDAEDDATSSSTKKKTRTSRAPRRSGWQSNSAALPRLEPTPPPSNRVMLVNEVPGQECRIAIIDGKRLDEYFVERASSQTVVGNIYKGRVTNVEPAIQAAFVDFGVGESGFLHVSDLHPKYFPGEGITEQVGKKIPRRQRPAIQDTLKKGQEILVQVLKQGIGSKGPTITSYLSIPGRLLVMMPNMDRVGISRKVSDDDQRRAMREILDSLDLPKGFGFIIRTAGFNSSKTDLKRDVSYLKRLWLQIDKRIQNTGAPCLLYAESDLLVRTIRDVVDTTITSIVIDEPGAFERATGFLKVIAPRAQRDMHYYDRSIPILSAFDIERQIEGLHNETAPLPSGGALVIQQTEALVAIDVNSGRSRSARDSETNAYETNVEAVDEICRQLRLRDLGGVIINDLIDMRLQSNRRDIEARIQRNLSRDRAKTTVLPISEFGIVEMTRQRMRPNTRSANFEQCPTCSGTGELLRNDAVAADALRRVALILNDLATASAEMIAPVAVAEILKNSRRANIVLIEERTKKKIVVRVSEAIAGDRVDLYAYNSKGEDLDVTRMGRPTAPKIEDLPIELNDEELRATDSTGSRKRRRRRGRTQPADATAIALQGGYDIDDDEDEDESVTESTDGDSSDAEDKPKKRRRRQRGRRGAKQEETPKVEPVSVEPIRIYLLARELATTSRAVLERAIEEGATELKNHMSSVSGDVLLALRSFFAPPRPVDAETEDEAETSGEDGDQPKKKRRRRRRGRRGGRNRDANAESSGDNESESKTETVAAEPDVDTNTTTVDGDSETETKPRRKRRGRRGGRGRRRKTSDSVDSESNDRAPEKPTTSVAPKVADAPAAEQPAAEQPAAKLKMIRAPRSLYGGRTRQLGTTAGQRDRNE